MLTVSFILFHIMYIYFDIPSPIAGAIANVEYQIITTVLAGINVH